MAPAKFDDFSKTAKDVLSEDYAEKNVSFKAKSKTNFEGWHDLLTTGGAGKDGATLTAAVDIDVGAKCATPTKITWKFPKPFGIAGLAFDKLEMDKQGKMKLEASLDKALHGMTDLKVDCKSDLKSMDSVSLGATYTGIANALCKAEFKATNPADYSAEFSYAVGGGATVGVKSTKASMADVGVQYVNGPMFCSAVAKGMFTAFTFHGYYKASQELKVACDYNFGGKTNGQFSAGVGYSMCPGFDVKGKISGNNGADLAVTTSVKSHLAKGLAITAGAQLPLEPSKAWTWGLAFNIE